jgi:hypothetical protein
MVPYRGSQIRIFNVSLFPLPFLLPSLSDGLLDPGTSSTAQSEYWRKIIRMLWAKYTNRPRVLVLADASIS